MTTVDRALGTTAPAAPAAVSTSGFWAVAKAICKRNLVAITRLPSAYIPSIFFPVMVIVAMSGAYSGVARSTPGFPTRTMVDWMLPFAIAQSSAITGMTTGIGLIRDLDTHFYDRLLLAPVQRLSLVAGLFMASIARIALPFTVVGFIAFAEGARLTGGFVGFLCLVVAAVGCAIIGSGWGIGMGLRLKSFSAVPLMFMGVFLLFFTSTVQVPTSLMSGWLKPVATANPITRILTLGRAGFTGAVTWGEVWPGLVAIGVLGSLFSLFAVRGMRSLDA
jgi:ABC-2 type transport system permease protein